MTSGSLARIGALSTDDSLLLDGAITQLDSLGNSDTLFLGGYSRFVELSNGMVHSPKLALSWPPVHTEDTVLSCSLVHATAMLLSNF